MLTALSNSFYHWRNPRATFATLSFFAALLLVTASCELSVTYRVFWYCCASFFFGARPIASRFPKYRHVVSPFCWFFWDCPTQGTFFSSLAPHVVCTAAARGTWSSFRAHGRVLCC